MKTESIYIYNNNNNKKILMKRVNDLRNIILICMTSFVKEITKLLQYLLKYQKEKKVQRLRKKLKNKNREHKATVPVYYPD